MGRRGCEGSSTLGSAAFLLTTSGTCWQSGSRVFWINSSLLPLSPDFAVRFAFYPTKKQLRWVDFFSSIYILERTRLTLPPYLSPFSLPPFLLFSLLFFFPPSLPLSVPSFWFSPFFLPFPHFCFLFLSLSFLSFLKTKFLDEINK